MMNNFFQRAVIGTTALTAMSVPAQSQDVGQFYAKAFGGFSAQQANDFTLNATPSSLSYKGGFTAGGAFGYDYANSPFRVDLEYAYRTDDVSTIPAAVGSGGDFSSVALMLNGYYVFETGSPLRPYLGAGIGVAPEIDYDVNVAGGTQSYQTSNTMAYQLIAGAEYPLSDQFSIFAEARYFSAGSVTLTGTAGSLRSDYDTLDLNLGVGFFF